MSTKNFQQIQIGFTALAKTAFHHDFRKHSTRLFRPCPCGFEREVGIKEKAVWTTKED